MREATMAEALAAKYPEQVTIVVTLDAEGTANVVPLCWVTQVSGEPLRFVVAIHKRGYSHGLLLEREEFVLAFPDKAQAEAVMFCGTRSGRKVNKETESGLSFTPASKVAPPLVEGCLTNLECRLVSHHDAGDHLLFVGEVVAAHVAEGPTEGLDGIYYQGGALYELGAVEPLGPRFES